MAVAGGVHGGHLPFKFRQPPTAMSTRSSRNRALRPQPTAMMSARSNRNRAMRSRPPIFISANPSHVNPHDLRDLYALCNHSCHRFPNVDSDGRVEPVDLHKLRIALSHSSVVVSVFCKREIVLYYTSFSVFPNSSPESSNLMGVGGDWLQRVVPVTPSNGQLVGFGRAISDSGLTGSIYDVMVIPSLRGMGIGKMIVNRIIRLLTSRGIYDIAALCSEEERHLLIIIREKGTEVYPIPGSGALNSLKMGKIWLEVCLISARGLQRTSSLFKLQWYAVGWIDPNNKYCSRIDASGNANPVWKTKFSAFVDNSESKFQDLSLHVEVYSREPIFLRERLQGTATVVLKEFLENYIKNSEISKPIEEVGSFQLRKRNTSKTQGFVDVSIRISEEREEPSSYTDEGFKLMDRNNGINIRTGHGASQAHPPQFHLEPFQHPAGNHPPANSSYAYPAPYPSPPAGGLSHLAAGGAGYQPHRTPPAPPPPSNVGYISTFLPRTDHLPQSYINMPSAGAASTRSGGAGLGLGAGALAAGAVIFGDDFMSGFDVPAGLQDPSVTIATNPPF